MNGVVNSPECLAFLRLSVAGAAHTDISRAMRLNNGLFSLLILVANVALSEPLNLHAPTQCLDILPRDAWLEGSSPTVRAFAG